jgi:hypothetical protein
LKGNVPGAAAALVLAACLAGCSLLGRPPEKPRTAGDDDLETLATWMTGSFSSYRRPILPADIRLHTARIGRSGRWRLPPRAVSRRRGRPTARYPDIVPDTLSNADLRFCVSRCSLVHPTSKVWDCTLFLCEQTARLARRQGQTAASFSAPPHGGTAITPDGSSINAASGAEPRSGAASGRPPAPPRRLTISGFVMAAVRTRNRTGFVS